MFGEFGLGLQEGCGVCVNIAHGPSVRTQGVGAIFVWGLKRAQAIHIHSVDPHPVIGAIRGLGSRAIRDNVDYFRALSYSYCIMNAGGPPHAYMSKVTSAIQRTLAQCTFSL